MKFILLWILDTILTKFVSNLEWPTRANHLWTLSCDLLPVLNARKCLVEAKTLIRNKDSKCISKTFWMIKYVDGKKWSQLLLETRMGQSKSKYNRVNFCVDYFRVGFNIKKHSNLFLYDVLWASFQDDTWWVFASS